jgi:hypothetical protein
MSMSWPEYTSWDDLDGSIPYTGPDGGGGKGGKGGKGKKDKEPESPYTENSGSAQDVIFTFLDALGLPHSLADWVWKQHLNGDDDAEIYAKLRDPNTKGGKVYAERFPAMQELSQRGEGITEQQYIQFEKAVGNLSARYGIPEGVYNNRNSIAQLMLNDLSPVEIENNMRNAASIVYGAPEIRAAFSQFYGVQGDGAAIAYFLDPEANQAELEKVYQTTMVGGTALANQLNVGKDAAGRIADLVQPSQQQAIQASTNAARNRELYTELIGERTDVTDEQGLLASYGADANAQDAVERRRSQRQAAYQGGGSMASGTSGVSGLSSAAQ